MTNPTSFLRRTPEANSMHKEFSTVRLNQAVLYDGRTIDAGSAGTVVNVYRGGLAYEVEFQKPFWFVVTVEADKVMK